MRSAWMPGALIVLSVTGCQEDPRRLSFELPQVGCEATDGLSACVGPVPRSVIVEDLDGRGGDEVVVFSATSLVTVVSVTGSGSTAATLRTGSSVSGTADRILSCDVDGDDRSELIHDGSQRLLDAAIWWQDPDPTAWTYESLGMLWLSMVHCAWEREGETPELMGFASGPQVVRILPRPGNAGVQLENTPLELPEELIYGRFSSSMLGLDGDHVLLLADPEEGILHVVHEANDRWVPIVDVEIGEAPPIDSVVFDLDADGGDDVILIAGTDDTTALWVGSAASAADGYLVESFTAMLGAAVTEVQVADLDADGTFDLLVTDLPGTTIRWLRGLGDGTFASDAAVELEPSMGVAPADVDGDGVVELVVLPAGRDRLDVIFDIADNLFTAA